MIIFIIFVNLKKMSSLFENIFKLFYYYNPKVYDFNYDFIFNSEVQYKLKHEGYAVVKNIVPDSSIEIIKEAYDMLSKSEHFYVVNGFIASASYGHAIHKDVHNLLSKVNNQILGKIIYKDKLYYDLINILALKFNNDPVGLFPHQDMGLIDESEGPSFFAWIPTEDITNENGAMLVLPRSHKWFRWQKTHNQLFTPFRNIQDEILKWMMPVYMDKGDVLIFDNSLLHASMPNNSNKVRICMNTSFAPNKFPLVNYQIVKNNDSKVYKYMVDETFYKNFYINPNEVPDKYHPPVIEKLRTRKIITKSNFIDIITNEHENKF